jgi:hypothetical protein
MHPIWLYASKIIVGVVAVPAAIWYKVKGIFGKNSKT